MDLYEQGVAFALASHEPKKLDTLLKPPVPKKVEGHGMIAIPKKSKRKPEPEGEEPGGG